MSAENGTGTYLPETTQPFDVGHERRVEARFVELNDEIHRLQDLVTENRHSRISNIVYALAFLAVVVSTVWQQLHG